MKPAKTPRSLAPWLWLGAWFAAAVAVRSISSGSEYTLARGLEPATFTGFHWLGYDVFGRDLLATVLRASLNSAVFAAIAVILAFAIGIFFGCSIAIIPSRPRFLSLRGLDFLLAFPGLLFALAWASVRGPGWGTLLFALLIGIAPPLVRLIYVTSRETLSSEYTTAAESLGASSGRIFWRYLIPSVLPVCRIKLPNLFAYALMAEATLSYLGIGAPIGRDTWGSLLSQGKDYLIEAPHIAIGTGIPLFLTILSLQWISENR
jgi:ABC-type dipeptide/oligopeptide/nickel transport system permease subunit